MSAMQAVLERSPRLRPKYLLFAAIGLMLAYVVPHDESFLVHPKDPMWQHYEPFAWWLLPHGVAGACALLLGPMQFSERLRRRFSQFHRVVGRIYVAGVFVAAPLGFYIQYFQERMGGARSFTSAAAVDAVLWMATTGIAMVFILKGKVQEHQQWMTRSFAVALVFLEGRVIGGLTGWENLSDRTSEAIVWACLAFSIISADVVLQWQALGRSRAALHSRRSVFALSGFTEARCLLWANPALIPDPGFGKMNRLSRQDLLLVSNLAANIGPKFLYHDGNRVIPDLSTPNARGVR